ncbi:MAG TPA: hypothetical protein VM846_04270 [Vicinamibacterales bacterium]|nr:hypothetical protein [Vicinamibacterales bacterium]
MKNRTTLAVAVAVFLAPLLAGSPSAQAPAPQAGQAQAPQGPGQGQGQAPARGAAAPQGRGRGGGRAPAPSKPAPKLASGRVQLNEKGVWIGGGGVGGRGADIPYQEWTRAVAADRRVNELEPHTRCKASGFQRQFLTPYGAEIVEVPALQRVFIFDIGGPHTFRTIYLDGRSHPKNLEPTYYGHSIGWWEGDTLVVDTIGYNEGFWIDRGVAPHTDKLHTVEKFTRNEFASMRYDLTIDDPGAYTKPWGGTMNLRLEPNTELFEYVCQQQNYAHELMVGQFKAVDRTTLPVP